MQLTGFFHIPARHFRTGLFPRPFLAGPEGSGVQTREVGGVTGGLLCTWWLLGLALKRLWLVPGGPPPALTAWTGLENTTLTLQRAGFWPERLLGL